MTSDAAITGYFDGSEGESGRVTLAGYLAAPNVWARFDQTWLDVLRSFAPPCDHLHMVDAMALRNDFGIPNGWSRDLVNELLHQLVHKCLLTSAWTERDGPSLLKLYCTVARDDWSRACGIAPQLRNYGSAGICGRFIAGIALRRLPQAEGQPEGYRSGSLALIFDRGEPFKRQVELALQSAKRCAAGRRGPLTLISDIQEADMRKTPGLQAADFLAWLVNRWQEGQCQEAAWLTVKSSPGHAYQLTAKFLVDWQSTGLDIRRLRLPSR